MIWSWINPYDRLTWWLEAIPVIIALPLLFYTRNSFPLTRISYYLIFVHAVILVVGAHYTYARVPLGFLIQDWFDFSRNHYDRIGHLAQGFVPAILAREILWRKQQGKGKAWLFFLVTCFCLAFSAFYELIEWWSAVIGGDGSVEFLGTQGDVWDAQWDMMLALIGAISAQLLLGGVHHRQMLKVSEFTG
ncbi:UNVERIFIED_CONTAM: hypothetical protein GTU68_064786 [Idotea baltica]|nr:hypothetical protein [Idotea baltica]